MRLHGLLATAAALTAAMATAPVVARNYPYRDTTTEWAEQNV